MSQRLRWDPALTTERSEPRLYQDRLRLGLVVGSAIIMVGGLLPWAEGRIGFLPKSFGGMDGAADGLILVTLGLVMMLIVRNRDFLDATDGVRRWAPMVIGLACLGVWIVGRLEAEQAIATWERDTGSGSLGIGWWLTGIGVITVLVLGSYASLRHHEGEAASAGSLLRTPRRSDIPSIVATLGAIAGAVAGGSLALALFPAVTVGVPMLFFAGIGVIIGAWAGRRLGTLLRRFTG
jgi:hypothetical protein